MNATEARPPGLSGAAAPFFSSQPYEEGPEEFRVLRICPSSTKSISDKHPHVKLQNQFSSTHLM